MKTQEKILCKFDNKNRDWSQVPEYNGLYLNAQQNYLNDLLRARGYVFLNEVYRAIGLPDSREGQSLGWDWNDTESMHIDFGIDVDTIEQQARDGAITLRLNVVGNILHVLPSQF